MKDADLIILGAGPAGTSAAITAADAGLNVTIIESLRFPRHRPGETLHPGIEPLLIQLGVQKEILEANFTRHEGHWVDWGKERRFVPFGQDENDRWRGFQFWRAEFDEILLERAKKLGVVVLQPCRAQRPRIEKRSVVGIETAEGFLSAKFLIDAAGGQHWLAKRLNIGIDFFTPKLIIRYAYRKGDHSNIDSSPSLKADEKSWRWTAKIRNDLLHCSRLYFDSESFESNVFENHKTGRLKDIYNRGADVSWRILQTPAGKGFFAIGDAASVLDPISSHGVLKAVMSGIMTSHLITQCLQKKLPAEQIVAIYNQWIKGWFKEDAKKLCEFYGKLDPIPKWLPETSRKLNIFNPFEAEFFH